MTPDDDAVQPVTSPAEVPVIEDAEERSFARRLRDQRTHVEDRIGETRRRLEDARPRSGVIDTVFRAVERDTATGGGVLSAAVAFRIFLFLVPFVFFFVVGLGFASDATDGNPQGLGNSIGIAGLVASAVKGAGDLSTTERITALVVSGFALFLSARAAVKVLRITHGLIWRVPIPRVASSSRAAGAFVGLIAVSMLAAAGVAWLRSESLALGVFGLLLSAAVPFGLWLLVSLWLPHADCPWWALTPGAGVVAVGTLVLHATTVYWFAYEIEAKSETYGAIGASLVLLLWAYMLGRIITGAAAANAAFWYRSEERQGLHVPAPVDIEARISEVVGGVETEES